MDTDTDTDNNYTPYERWVRRLYLTNLFHPVKMGLSNMQTLHQLLGSPMDQVRNILVQRNLGWNGWMNGFIYFRWIHFLHSFSLTVVSSYYYLL